MPSSPHEFFKVFLLSSDYRPSVDRPSTERWPMTDRYIGEVSTNYRQSVGEKSAKCRWSIGEQKAISAETHLERLLTVSRPTIHRLSTAISTDYRPTIDRLSTEYRPSVEWVLTECRPSVDRLSTAISTDTYRSTLPTVNMILKVYCRVNELQTRHWQERTIIPGLNWGRKTNLSQCVVQDVFRRKVCPNTWCILCPSLYLRRITRRTTNVCSSSSRWIINSREIRLHFPFSGNWNKPDKDWKKGNSF